MPIREARLPGVAADAGPREGVPVPLLPTLVLVMLVVLLLRSLRDPGRAGSA
jgi:hypothetical protein